MNILITNKKSIVRDSFMPEEVMKGLYSIANVTENPYDRGFDLR